MINLVYQYLTYSYISVKPEVREYILQRGVTTYQISSHRFTTDAVWKDINDNGASILIAWPGIAISDHKIWSVRRLRLAKTYGTLKLNHR